MCHHSDSERPTKVAPRKHSIKTHVPKDRNGEVCLRTKMTRALCRRRTGEAVPRAEKFSDMVTADHKVLNEEGASRNNHRFAVVVQDLATSIDSILSVQNENFSGDGKGVYKSFSSRHRSQKLFAQTIRWNLANLVKNFHGIIELRHPVRSETNGVAERAIRRVKEGTSAVLLQSGLDEKWWAASMECYCFLRNVQDLLADGKTPNERRFGEPLKGRVIPFGARLNIIRFLRKTSKDSTNLARKSCQEYSSDV